jgi:peptide/nickel transport system ATP-binding protein
MSAAAPVLGMTDLTLQVDGAGTIVDRATLEIAAGEIFAVVGESGSGKTMLARAVLDLLPPGIRRREGRIALSGRELTTLAPEAMRRVRGAEIGMVFQEPMVSLNPALTIGRQMTEGLRLHRGLTAGEARTRAIAILERIRMGDPARSFGAYPHEFSGGMRQRIMLASVMLLQPRLLIADEPTTALDTLVQQDVLGLMVELARENGTAILLISHDLALVGRYARRVAVMQQGKIVEQGSTERILSAPQHPYTRRLLDALPRRGPARPIAPAATPLIELRDLVIDYPGRKRLFAGETAAKRAVDGVSLSLRPGETMALVGQSGSGKTTLGRALVGLVTPSSGEVLFHGRSMLAVSAAARRAMRRQCQFIFQDPYSSLDPRMRVGEVLAEPLRNLPDLAGAG